MHVYHNVCEMNSQEHCGDHDTTCLDTQICESGRCKCKAGFALCSDVCTDIKNDPNHCGGCNHECHTEHARKTECNEGTCHVIECEDSYHIYDNGCEPDDVTHCGFHDTDCLHTIQGWKTGDCVHGQCSITECQIGFHLSEGKCVEDTNTCCGAKCLECNDDKVCSDGVCKSKCDSPLIYCDNSCVNYLSSNSHCGACDSPCNALSIQNAKDANCSGGQCIVAECLEGYHKYQNNCELDDVNHCGAHGKSCPELVDGWAAGECLEKECVIWKCKAGFHLYDNRCIAETKENCGASGTNCLNGTGVNDAKCTNGQCEIIQCKTDYHLKENACIEDTPANCGSSGTNCLDGTGVNDAKCTNGQCEIIQCKTDYHLFGNQCELDDEQHCGSHDSYCGEHEECNEGKCVPICGNSIINEHEDCDYGNPEIPDNMVHYGIYGMVDGVPLCNPNTCQLAAYCGDGHKDEADGEECDDGAEQNHFTYGIGCTADCRRAPYCGDGIFTPGSEQCDPSVAGGNEGCREDCTPKDGYLCSAVDGTCVEGYVNKCGDSVIENDEECDQTGNGCIHCRHDDDYKCIGSIIAPCVECTGTNTYANYPCCTTNTGEQCKKISDGCGDGILDPDGFEECDDGNTIDGDGCSANGRIEDGYVCMTAGVPCTPICGDGILVGSEACDDGNRIGGDGCSANCTLEVGYYCQTPGIPCELDTCGNGFVGPNEICDGQKGCGDDCHSVKSGYCYSKSQGVYSCGSSRTCGNYILEYGEACDDGNVLGGDGCSDVCTVETGFECPLGVECRPKCGDGIVMWHTGEICDLGVNNGKGMGCSKNCQIEEGFACTNPAASYPDTIELPVTYRDFVGRNLSSGSGLVNSTVYNELSADSDCIRTVGSSEPGSFVPQIHGRVSDLNVGQAWLKKNYGYPDFEGFAGNLCFGLVEDTLDSEGKPVFNGSISDNCCGSMNSTQCSAFVQGGSYNGANYPTYVGGTGNTIWHHVSKLSKRHHLLCGKSFNKWYRTDNVVSKEYKTTLPLTQITGNPSRYVFDSAIAPYSGYFSPIDGQGWKENNPLAPNNHNGSFTTEISTMFLYKGGETLNFAGDDDVWVFINGKLFLDVGGMHARVEGQNTLSNQNCSSVDSKNGGIISRKCDTRYGIYEGGLYELKIFHAERAASGAEFKLTLDGFGIPAANSCSSLCGDGVVASNEECDIAGHTNDDVALMLGCVNCIQTSYCGNHILEYGEGCDSDDSLCTNCKLDTCGNGHVDSVEDCDSSSDPLCNPNTCRWFCGDGIVQTDKGEECDKDSHNNDDGSSGCTTQCKSPYCGDGVVSTYQGEVCDDGMNNTTYGEGCMPGCMRMAPFCGDGIIQKDKGEACDLGKAGNMGDYGGCTSDCKRAPYCGDGIVNGDEQCDGESNCDVNCRLQIN